MDYETGAEPMNFIHVFLYSQALECLVLSMVGCICALQFCERLVCAGLLLFRSLLNDLKQLSRSLWIRLWNSLLKKKPRFSQKFLGKFFNHFMSNYSFPVFVVALECEGKP
jgi:hypothetical protein